MLQIILYRLDSISQSISAGTMYGIASCVGNFVMLMPLGLFFRFYISGSKKCFISIFLFSLGIEAVQFIIGLIIGCNYRSVDIDDVILNVCGGIISHVCIDFIIKKYRSKTKSNNTKLKQ